MRIERHARPADWLPVFVSHLDGEARGRERLDRIFPRARREDVWAGAGRRAGTCRRVAPTRG